MRTSDQSNRTHRASDRACTQMGKRGTRKLLVLLLAFVLVCLIMHPSVLAQEDVEGGFLQEGDGQQPAVEGIAPDPVYVDETPLGNASEETSPEALNSHAVEDGSDAEDDEISVDAEELQLDEELDGFEEDAAQEDAAQWTADGTLVFSAEELRAAADQTGSVRLGNHIVLDGSSPIIIPANAFFSIDLNGWSIVYSSSVPTLFDVRGHLTITDASELNQTGSIVASETENVFSVSGEGAMMFQCVSVELSRGSRAFRVVDGGRLAIRSGRITGNDEETVPEGGAVYVSGANSVVEFSDGVITGTHAVSGGAVYAADGGAFRMVRAHDTDSCDAQIQSCTATENGGAVYVAAGGAYSMQGGAVSENTAGANGGGIAVAGGIVSLRGGTIAANGAQTGQGGGIWAGPGGAVDANVPVDAAVQITGNSAGGLGGGIFLADPGLSQLDGHGQVTGNSAGTPAEPSDLVPAAGTDIGGDFVVSVILEDPTRKEEHTETAHSTAAPKSPPEATVAASSTAAPTAEVVVREARSAHVESFVDLAGALADEAVSDIHFVQDISMDTGDVPILHVPPAQNVVLHLDGHKLSAIGAGFGSLFDVQGLLVLRSDAPVARDAKGDGACILFEDGDCVIHVAETGTFFIESGRIEAGNGTEHAITAAPGSRLAMLGGQIRGQRTARDGGAILLEAAADPTRTGAFACISGGTIEGTGAAYGGGIAVLSGAQLELSGTASINGCHAEDGAARVSSGLGGGVYVEGGVFVMNGGSIDDCSATRGGAVYAQSGTVYLGCGTISGCAAQERGSAVYLASGARVLADPIESSLMRIGNDNVGSSIIAFEDGSHEGDDA